MKVLITGATGFIGRRVVGQLADEMADVEILTLNRDVEKATKLLPYSVCRHEAVANMHRAVAEFRPEVCIHLAAFSTSRNDTSIINPIIDTNISFGVKLLDALRVTNGLKLFVNVGSFAEYRDGAEAGFKDAYLYTATKSAFRHFVEYYAALSGFKYLTAVPYTVYGGGDDTAKKLMDYMFDSIGAAESVKMSPGNQILDFVHVGDVVRFFVAAVKCADRADSMPQGATYHIGTGVGTRVRDLAAKIEARVGQSLNIEWGGLDYRPLDVMCAVAPKFESNIIPWHADINLDKGIDMLVNSKCK